MTVSELQNLKLKELQELAKEKGINVLSTSLSAYDAAIKISGVI